MTKSGLQFHQSSLLLIQEMLIRFGYSSKLRYSGFFGGETFNKNFDFEKELDQLNHRYLQMHNFTSRFDEGGFQILNKFTIKPNISMGYFNSALPKNYLSPNNE